MPEPTLILSPRMTEDSIALWGAAGRLGWNVERAQGFRPPVGFEVEGEVVLYVEALTAPLFAEALGVELAEPPLGWLAGLPKAYRRREVELMTLGEARRIVGRRFVKPPNDKSFAARVYSGAELPEGFPDDMAVLVAEVVEWEVEFRCFILDREVRTFSVYLRRGKVQREAGFSHDEAEGAGLMRFMSEVLTDDRVELPRAAVDAGVIKGRGWAVVEQNAAWGSGIYGCESEEVLKVLRHATPRVG